MAPDGIRLDPAAVRTRLDALVEARQVCMNGGPEAGEMVRRLAHGVARAFELVRYEEITESARRLELASEPDLLFRLDELVRVLQPLAGEPTSTRGVLSPEAFAARFATMVTKSAAQRAASALALVERDPPRAGAEDDPHHRRLLPAVLTESLRPSEIIGLDPRHHLLVLFPETPLSLAAGLLRGGLRALPKPLSFSAGLVPVKPGMALDLALAKAQEILDRPGNGGAGRILTPEGEGIVLKGRVLLAEDDPVYAAAMKDRLLREGFEVIHVGSGTDAVRMADELEFQLVVLDVKMPGLDGFEVLYRLRRHPRLHSTLIIMVTGIGTEYDIAKGLAMDADDYLVKPFSPVELVARVQRLLRRQAAATDPSAPPSP